MDIVLMNSESLINSVSLAGPVKGQFLDTITGQLWRLAAGEVAGAYVAESAIEQAATLTAECALLVKSNSFRIPLPDGLRTAGNRRFVTLNIYNNGVTDKTAISLMVDVVTGRAFNPGLSPTSEMWHGDLLGQKVK